MTLTDLGFDSFFLSQLETDELDRLAPLRLSAVQRKSVTGLGPDGATSLALPGEISSGDLAVGDWVLAAEGCVERLLERKTLLRRGTTLRASQTQIIAANVDTLFITTSCNDDFNPARLERYLAVAYEAGIAPVLVLTKADRAEDPDAYVAQAQTLGRDLPVVALNAKDPDGPAALAPWCGPGRTVAFVGTSGVGKTTIANALTGTDRATADIREDDARGRHTTTARSLHAMIAGGWLIDTPGMRSFGVAEAAAGIDATFAEITELAARCRFRDCRHEGEPGCAVQAAIAAGEIDPDRLRRYDKLRREDAQATETIAQRHARSRKLNKIYRAAKSRKSR